MERSHEKYRTDTGTAREMILYRKYTAVAVTVTTEGLTKTGRSHDVRALPS